MNKENIIKLSLDRLLPKNASVLVGFSGGVDSVVLLTMLKKYRPDLNLFAAHVNHMLRDDAISDAQFCENFCEENNVAYVVTNENVKKYCLDNKLGTEEGARILRHQFFKDWMYLKKIDFLCLGHHKNDRAETIILNFLRGSGIHGLSSMRESEKNIIRPLLDLKKSDILEVASRNNLKWVEDHTNHENDYDRNWLRNDIIPQLETRRKGVVDVLSRNAKQFEMVSDYISKEAEKFILLNYKENKNFSKSTFINIESYKDVHPALQNEILRKLYTIINGSGAKFSGKIIKEVNKWLQSHPKNGGSMSFFSGVRLINKNGELGVDMPDEALFKVRSFIENHKKENIENYSNEEGKSSFAL